MKKIIYLFAFALLLISCNKEDDIQTSQIVGTWVLVSEDPNFALDGSLEYTFKADSSFVCHTSSYIAPHDTTIYGRFKISEDKTLLSILETIDTINHKTPVVSSVYNIMKLNSNRMELHNLLSSDSKQLQVFKRER